MLTRLVVNVHFSIFYAEVWVKEIRKKEHKKCNSQNRLLADFINDNNPYAKSISIYTNVKKVKVKTAVCDSV